MATVTEQMLDPSHSKLPPTPPETVVDDDNGKDPETAVDDKCKGIGDFALPPFSTPPAEVLDVDKPTPDSHVPRDPRLIRLTGVHPFNVEAPLTDLYNEGFLTSPELFYVRNHGAVPEVHDEDVLDWEFSVEGYVPLSNVNTGRPKLITIEEWWPIPLR
jgi:nitrate reductase (NAD(P)H)